MRKLKITLAIMVLFLAVDAGVLWLVKPEAFSSPAAMRQVEAELLAQVLVRVMNFRIALPQQVDNTARLDSIHAEGSRVIYNLSLTASGDNFNRIAAALGDHLRKTGCDRADYQKMLSYGLTVELNLHSQDGIAAAPIDITPQMCGLDK